MKSLSEEMMLVVFANAPKGMSFPRAYATLSTKQSQRRCNALDRTKPTTNADPIFDRTKPTKAQLARPNKAKDIATLSTEGTVSFRTL